MADSTFFHFRSLPNFELEFRNITLTSGYSLYGNGEKLRKKGNKFFLLNTEGEDSVIELKVSFDFLAPAFVYKGEVQHPNPTLPGYLIAFAFAIAAIPIILLMVGGGVGTSSGVSISSGLVAFIVFSLNLHTLRWNTSLPIRFAVALITSATATGLWYFTTRAILG